MSWMIKKIGKRSSVRDAIQNELNIPETIKACILDNLQDEPVLTQNKLTGVRVEGYGHKYEGENSYYSNIGKLEIEPFELIE